MIVTTTATTSPESVPYYYGHISRENAELILFDRGCMDGMYLLRASSNSSANSGHGPEAAGYVLSLCHTRQVVHYRIVKDVADGLCYLSGMAHDKHAGPIELIHSVPEFAGFLNIPCLKPLDVFMPGVNCSISEDKVKEAVRKKSTEWGIQESDFGSMLDDKQSEVWRLLLKTLHEYEPWFYGGISREESEAKLVDSGLTNGKFLVRERDPCSFTLSLCHEGLIKHYKIDVLSTGEVGIQDGPRFENIISLVSHYSVFSDGLWCQLQEPCISKTENSASANGPQSVISVSESWASNVRSIYPVLPKEDQASPFPISTNGACAVKSPQPTTQPLAKTSKASANKKATSIWFINHLPKLNKDRPKSPQQNGHQKPVAALPPPVTAKSNKVPARKSTPKCSKPTGKLSKLDISSPVIMRPAPPPPAIVSPSVASGPTQAPNGIAAPIQDDDSDQEKQQLNSLIIQNELSASTPVPLMFPLPPVIPATSVEDSALSKRPLPAPRQRRALPAAVEVTIDAVPPSPLSPSTPFSCARKSSGLVFTYPTTVTTIPPIDPISTSASNDVHGLEEPKNDGKKRLPWMKNAANSSGPNMIDVITELKGRSSKNGRGDSEVNEDANEERQPPNSQKSNDLPHYEEIDPEFNDPDPDCGGPTQPTTIIAENGHQSLLNPEIENAKWDQTKDSDSNRGGKDEQQKPPWTKEESEFHFKTIRRYRKGPTAIDRKNLLLEEKIGVGNFGDVVKAVFKSGQVEVPCAIKTLRQEAISSGKADILREARIMTKLDHAHIVRLFGVSEGDPFLLVMELAPLGPLNSYVRSNLQVSPRDILLLIYQVALGMEYLESKQFVHRDLAARNVLLVNESFAKISDFGMSRALGLHTDYYRVEPEAKLPLKWYAPECIYYFRFSCKSDVWSYGITMWEALSYGERPYQGLTGHEILTMFSTNRRLACPEKCSQEMYTVMWNCWQFRPEDRPTFAELKSTLRDHLNI